MERSWQNADFKSECVKGHSRSLLSFSIVVSLDTTSLKHWLGQTVVISFCNTNVFVTAQDNEMEETSLSRSYTAMWEGVERIKMSLFFETAKSQIYSSSNTEQLGALMLLFVNTQCCMKAGSIYVNVRKCCWVCSWTTSCAWRVNMRLSFVCTKDEPNCDLKNRTVKWPRKKNEWMNEWDRCIFPERGRCKLRSRHHVGLVSISTLSYKRKMRSLLIKRWLRMLL